MCGVLDRMSTIDDALEGLPDDGKDKKNDVIYQPSELIKSAQEVLGNYLVNEYFKVNNLGKLENFLRTLGPFVLQITPTKIPGNDVWKQKYNQKCSLVGRIDKETWLTCIKTFDEGYLVNTDLAEVPEEGIELISNGSDYLPQIAALKYIVLGNRERGDTHPCVIAMGIDPKYRALVALAIDNEIDKNAFPIVRPVTKNFLLINAPSLEGIAEIAKKFDVKDLKPIIAEINRVLNLYNNIWADD